MAASWTVVAPAHSRAFTNAEAWSRARVTTTRLPNRGRDSNHERSCAATSPMTMVEGDARGWSARVPRVARMVRCSGRVPHCTDAAGVSADSPPAISRSAMARMRPTPMSTTTVPPTRATASQFTDDSGRAGSSWPVTTVNDVDEWRRVTGMPA